jgi:transcriptional regulator with PAS, ATPase and Fis domain
VKLLRVLQEREVERVGDSRPRPVDIRVIAATNRDIREEVRRGRFREDLYYRLNVISVRLPPLRERLEDVPALADQFIPRFAREMGKEARTLTDEALDLLLRHDWPGNVRELENTLEHAVLRSRGPLIFPRDLPPEVAGTPPERPPLDRDARVDAALKVAGGRLGRAAEILGVHRTTLWRWLRQRDPAGCASPPYRDNPIA